MFRTHTTIPFCAGLELGQSGCRACMLRLQSVYPAPPIAQVRSDDHASYAINSHPWVKTLSTQRHYHLFFRITLDLCKKHWCWCTGEGGYCDHGYQTTIVVPWKPE